MTYHVFVSSNKLLGRVLCRSRRNEKIQQQNMMARISITITSTKIKARVSILINNKINALIKILMKSPTTMIVKNYHVQPLVSAMIPSLYLSCSSRSLYMILIILVLTIYHWSRRDTHSLFSTIIKVSLINVRWRLRFHYYWDPVVLVIGFMYHETSRLLPGSMKIRS